GRVTLGGRRGGRVPLTPARKSRSIRRMTFSESLTRLRTGFARSFWVANTLELFERLAFYGAKAVLAIYLVEKVGLGPTGNTLIGLYTFAVFFLPILAGTI